MKRITTKHLTAVAVSAGLLCVWTVVPFLILGFTETLIIYAQTAFVVCMMAVSFYVIDNWEKWFVKEVEPVSSLTEQPDA